MSSVNPAVKTKLTAEQKQAMKQFRERRGGANRTQQQENRDNRKASAAIRECLAGGPATVPELARATSLPAARVLWHIAALRKYGKVREESVDGDYIRYALVAAEPDDPPAR